jgi:hypothetical protein
MADFMIHVSRIVDGQRLSCGYFKISAKNKTAAQKAAIKQAKTEYQGSSFRIEKK